MFTYDADGNMLTQTDARGNTTTHVYNAIDQRIEIQYADGTTTKTAFDKRGLAITQTDQNNRTTNFAFDGLGRLTSVTDAIGQVTSYGYDEVGNKLTQTDAKNRVTSWDYDALGRPTSRTLPLGQSESYTYDAVGNRITHTDFNGATHTFTYELNNDWLLNEQYADGKTIGYSYNAIGQRLNATDEQGSYNYTYDNRNRLTLETKPNGDSIGYGYDDNGNRTTLTTTVNGLAKTATYDIDAANRMSSVTDSDNRTTGYTYDENGNQTTIDQANGTNSITTFDELNRITNITHRGVDNGILLGLSYTLDPTGRRTVITESTGRQSTYIYDDIYRLTGDNIIDSVNGNYNATYEYDEVGNRTSETINGVETQYTVDDNDRLTEKGGTTYQYDDNGNTLSESLGGAVTTYAYSSRNRLLTTDKGGATISLAYDPDGIRVQKIVDGESTEYLVDSNRAFAQVIHERVGSSELGYTYGTDLVGLDTGSQSFSYLTDALGSTRLLSDSNGLIADSVVYNAWGLQLGGGDLVENKYLFTGEQFDVELDQVYLRARYMDPGSGRFTNMDIFPGFEREPAYLHKYVYANNSPVNGVDPSGLFVDATGTVAAASAGGVITAASGSSLGAILSNIHVRLLLVYGTAALTSSSQLVPEESLQESREDLERIVEVEAQRKGRSKSDLLYHYSDEIATDLIMADQCIDASRKFSHPRDNYKRPAGAYATNIEPWDISHTVSMLEILNYANPTGRDLSWFVAVGKLGFKKVGGTTEYVKEGRYGRCVGVKAIMNGPSLLSE